MTKLRKFLAEPLLHFLLIGAGIFLYYQIVSPAEQSDDSTIVVTAERQDNLRSQFEATRMRAPTQEEMVALIANYLRDEALYREAKALGLDQDDQVVRGRMRQKMEFFVESGTALLEPDDAELQKILDANPDQYSRPGLIAFRQVYLGENFSPDEAKEILARLTEIGDGPEFASFGQRSLLPIEVPLSARQRIANTFGEAFADTVRGLKKGEWVGPVRSGYGSHFIYITDETPPVFKTLEEVRPSLVEEWRYTKANELLDLQAQDLLGKYDIVVEPETDG